MKTNGIILLVIGFALTIVTTFDFFTKEKVVDIGQVEITRNKPNTISWSPIVGVIIMGIGGVMLWKGSTK